MPYQILDDEHLEIDGLPLLTPAWVCRSLAPVWESPAVRGEDILIPGAAGVVPKPRRVTVTPITLELDIVGDFDWEGNRHTDQRHGLWTNAAHLNDHLASPPSTTDGTRWAIHHPPPPANPRAGPVHVLRLRIAPSGANHAIGQLELSLPYGALAEQPPDPEPEP